MKQRKSEGEAKKRRKKTVLSIKTGETTSAKSRLESEKRAVSGKSCVEPVTPMPKRRVRRKYRRDFVRFFYSRRERMCF